MIRTKVVVTIGPASSEPGILRQLMKAGMDVARLNFSHGDQEVHGENIAHIRAAAEEVGKPVAILADLQGPKLRVGSMDKGGVAIAEGEQVVLTTEPAIGHRPEEGPPDAVIPVQYADLPKDVSPGERILLDDALMELRVEEVTATEITCRVITGGTVRDHKGLNVPGTGLSIPAITEKDWADLAFALEQGVDWVALSFVRSADEVRQLKDAIAEQSAEDAAPLVMAKIEKPQALDSIDAIIKAADGIMVARGDLGIEVPAEKVPMAQKRLIRLANTAGKPVITATQMLESMIQSPRPTRAEASDVANAILDGTDAIMLSGETAIGQYPLEAVRTMARIAEEIETATLRGPWRTPRHASPLAGDVTDAVSHATCQTAHDLQAAAIIAATASGKTGRSIAKYRPHAPLVVVTPTPIIQRQLMLTWGVIPLLSQRAGNTDEILHHSIQIAHSAGLVREGARVVLTAGITPFMPGTTNLMSVELVQAGGERVVPSGR